MAWCSWCSQCGHDQCSRCSHCSYCFIGAIRTTTTNSRVSFIDFYLVFPTNFRMVFLPHTNTVILLELYFGTIPEPGNLWENKVRIFIKKPLGLPSYKEQTNSTHWHLPKGTPGLIIWCAPIFHHFSIATWNGIYCNLLIIITLEYILYLQDLDLDWQQKKMVKDSLKVLKHHHPIPKWRQIFSVMSLW